MFSIFVISFPKFSCEPFYQPECLYLQWGASGTHLFMMINHFISPSGAFRIQWPWTPWTPSSFVDYPKIFLIAAFLPTIWFWLYVLGSVITRIFATFEFVRDHLDVEHKPLYCIGLVAGTLLAILWWAAALGTAIL